MSTVENLNITNIKISLSFKMVIYSKKGTEESQVSTERSRIVRRQQSSDNRPPYTRAEEPDVWAAEMAQPLEV